jgi:predicted DNA binding CopG/RHH family protein
MKKTYKEITVYDKNDTTNFINAKKTMKISDLGFALPKELPTKVISIRLPTQMYNKIRAYATSIDMPYQAYMKYLLTKGIEKDFKGLKTRHHGD